MGAVRVLASFVRSKRAATRLAAAAGLLGLVCACGTTVPVQQTEQLGAGLGTAASARTAVQSAGPTATSSQDLGAASTAQVPGGTTGTTTTAGPRPMTQRSAGSTIPPVGPGWDQHNIYVGVVTVTDAPTVGHLLGVNSLDYGDQNSYSKAMFDYVNSHGGLFGRSLVPVTYDVSSTTDPNTSAQAACAKFTQDRRVAVALGALNNRTFFACMKAARVPVITLGYGTVFRAGDLAAYKGWLYFWQNLSFERLVPVWLDRLQAQGYFTGWDTTNGRPSGAPVKVGLVYSSDDLRPQAFAYLKNALARRGIVVAEEFQGSSPSDYSNAVVKFRGAGVTHVFLDPSAALFYPPQAEDQHYYARYAVTSDDYIQPFLQDTAPAAQLRGMMGVGWIPNQDVDLSHVPGPNAGQARCFKIMRAAGASLAKDNYQYVAETVCDGLFLFLDLAHAGGGLDPASLLRSVGVAGSGFPWASQLGTGVAASDLSLAPTVRGLEYVQSCRCVQYVGPSVPVR